MLKKHMLLEDQLWLTVGNKEASRNPHQSEVHWPPSTSGIDYTPFGFSPFPTGSADMSQDDKQPFFLSFIKGNISRCAGCGLKDLRQIDGRPHPPPGDLCLQQKDNVLFENPKSGKYQLSKELRNVYYYARVFFCVTKKYPDFSPWDLKVPSDIKHATQKLMYISQRISLLFFRVSFAVT